MKNPLFASRRRQAASVALAAALALGACVHPLAAPRIPNPQPLAPPPACNVALCNISQTTWNDHIDPRHCQGTCEGNNKSIFAAVYCGSLANAIAFCQTLMGRPNCAPVQQPGTRVAYGADFAATVGEDRGNACANTVHGTVIYDTGTGAVVTQFPGNP
ncbi:MAG TPA: hypothetical protein VOA87_04915 [Thermoanaerobaculia bacterium]|nr:hypothetical protein [Thermoanaerobaculia bacterium]